MRAGVRAACAFVAFALLGGAATTAAAANPSPTAAQQRARDAFYQGDTLNALTQAVASEERWIAGLAAFRLNNFEESQRHFEAFAADSRFDDWNRAAGAYWAARSAIAAGRPQAAPALLRMAARYERTFYGILAQRQLGVEPTLAATDMVRAASDLRPSLDGASAPVAVVNVEPASATEVATDATDVAAARFSPATSVATIVNTDADYPMPMLAPEGGFTMDRAMVYAIVRQESRFNPRARSRAGATGLMQLMPTTAALVARRTGGSVGSLTDPGQNLRLGQDYVSYLLQTRTVSQDLLRMVAAYNGGPGTVLRVLDQLGAEPDALMLMESLPYSETRAYVERVMANYWIYRRMMGRDSASLDAVAGGGRLIDVALDQ